MEILINELSIDCQFTSLEDFIEISLNKFVKIYSLLSNQNIHPLKNYNFYNVKITQNETLHHLLTYKDKNGISDEVRKFKKIIDKCILEPYWESDIKHNPKNEFKWENRNVSNTSLAESYIRNCPLISFIPSLFESNVIEIKNNDISKKILNFHNSLELANHLYEIKKITFNQLCVVIFKDTKLCFDQVNIKASFDLINDKNDENEFLNSFKLFNEMSWDNILMQSGKGKNKVGLSFEKYSDQKYFENYKTNSEIYKFRCSQKFRAFGYRLGNIFYVLEFDLTHKLSD